MNELSPAMQKVMAVGWIIVAIIFAFVAPIPINYLIPGYLIGGAIALLKFGLKPVYIILGGLIGAATAWIVIGKIMGISP